MARMMGQQLQDEIKRTESVIADRTRQGLDLTAQLNRYKGLTGKSYNVDPQYKMYKGIADTRNQMNSYVNNIFDQTKNARVTALQAQRDQAVNAITAQKNNLKPQYQQMRNQTDAVNQQNVLKLREMMAANGLTATGENVSANVAMNNERVNSLNKLHLQEQEATNELDRRISDLNDPREEQAMLMELEAQRAQALFDANNRAEDIGYGRYRDGIADERYNKEFQYNAFRDRVGDNRYADELKYNRGQDQKQWDYQTGRDKVSDAQWKAQFDEDVKRYGLDYALKNQAQQHSMAIDNAQLSLNQQKEQRIASGNADEDGNPIIKPKSQENSYNDAITYFSGIKNDIKKHGAYRVEQGILNDPKALEEIRSQGYDIASYIDALYYVASDGRFKKKADYDEYVKSLSEW
jgi:hypothetical protein